MRSGTTCKKRTRGKIMRLGGPIVATSELVD
jgi:hypothetical protein